MKLSELEQYNFVTIQCHDNPDADTISSGYALYCYFNSRHKKVRLIYSGQNKIKKKNLCLMKDKLNIPIRYVCPNENKVMEGLLITVDCQYGAGNVSRFQAENVAVIDHHPSENDMVELSRIQPDLGSCATLVWSMLLEEGYPVNEDVNLGTALYYGLYTDTNQFSELFNPLDMDMREMLSCNKRLLKQFRTSNFSLKELEIVGVAMFRYNYNDEHRFAVIKAQPCDPNILGIISDFLLQVEEIDTCVVYNEINDGYKFSVRSCIKEVNANELAVFLAEGIGSGGGHNEKAGGFISMKLYEENYPTLHSEAYFNNRMAEYFKSYTLIFADKTKLDVSTMQKYKRLKRPICYVKATDIAEVGTSISVRSKCGSVDVQVKEDIYFAVERNGIIHFVRSDFFQKYLYEIEQKPSEDYFAQVQYMPTIKNWSDGNTYRIDNYAKLCMPKDTFIIYAKKLTNCVKVFPKWNGEKYMRGVPGDYLAASGDDLHNVFIEPGSIFLDNYEQI